jgi:cellobiose phosphorylase
MSRHAATLARTLHNAAGLRIDVNANGSIRRMDCHGVMLNLFLGNEVEGGPANLWLRRHGAGTVEAIPLLGPLGPLQPLRHQAAPPPDHTVHEASGEWQGLHLRLQLRLAASEPAWFWHVSVQNRTSVAQTVDLVHAQDIGLSAYSAIRLNEHYVSHYIDLTPLQHERHGVVLAARQNLAVAGRHPWALVGSLRRGIAFATDGLQVQGLALRAGRLPQGIAQGLPGQRLQHEHALLAIQDATLTLAPGQQAELGFFGRVQADHPAATASGDLALVDTTLALPEAQGFAPAPAAAARAAGAVSPVSPVSPVSAVSAGSLFSHAPMLLALDLDRADIDALFGTARRHEERDDDALLSFFHGDHCHVVLRAKELLVQRPHGHILRSGAHLVPDETALTSTTWMAGVFHSMVTQGHVSINRFLSTVHSWLGLFRSHGQRIFVQIGGVWQQLGVPSAFEIEPAACRWVYKHAGGLIEVRSRALAAPHALELELRVLAGDPLHWLVTHHIALGDDDGSTALRVPRRVTAAGVFIGVPKGSSLAARFGRGGFRISALPGSRFERVGGDELLFGDGASRGQPFVCIASAAVASFGLRIVGRLIRARAAAVDAVALPQWTVPADSPWAGDMARLTDVLPWYLHNALVHYLAPRGLEQYSGGGWGTRDVCQGPLEMLLALGRPEPVRDLLLRVFAAQNADGDWPQWFSFFERERDLRAGDSHGDIVFWPLLGLARYLIASEDAALLDESVPFFAASGSRLDGACVWQHVERALAVIRTRRIAGTHLAAYGHGDWNDSLQPADPALRERLCSAWTVTLHHQVFSLLASALHGIGRVEAATALAAEAAQVQADFQRLLVVDGVVTGYALFPPGQPAHMLLHPSDRLTGVRYSLLPMMHAILENMLSPEQARTHLGLIEAHLLGPDGARLFDRPLPYRGGPEQLFQRAETSAFFGREIGVMYTHAHLRYAEALAHLGEAQRFFDALCKSHALGLRERVPSASLRQSNCYFSSSDAAFSDRYEAGRNYGRVAAGSVALNGGWRIYSSGPGIAIGLVVGSLLGVRRGKSVLIVDPVMPPALDGLRARLPICGQSVDVLYRVGTTGCGPVRLELNGSQLPFTRGANPYRNGAAEVSMAVFASRLTANANLLVVHLG